MISKKLSKLKVLISCAALLPALLLSSCSDNTGNDDNSERELEGILNPNAPSTADGNMGEVKLETGNLYAVISVKDFGDIEVKLFPDIAPEAVANFVKAANEGYYDGKNFHRIMSNFMIQGGSLNGDGMTDLNGVSYGVERSPNARHFYGAMAMGKSGTGDCGLQFYIVNSKDTEAFSDIENEISNYEDLEAQYKEVVDEIEKYKEENGEEGLNLSQAAQYVDLYHYFNALVDYVKDVDSGIKEKYGEIGGVPFLDGGYTVFGQTVSGFDVIDKISAAEVEASPSNPDEFSKPVNEVLIDKVVIKTF